MKRLIAACAAATLMFPVAVQGHEKFDGYDGKDATRSPIDLKWTASGGHTDDWAEKFGFWFRTYDGFPNKLLATRGAFGAVFWKQGEGGRPYNAMLLNINGKLKTKVIRYNKNGSFDSIGWGRAGRNGNKEVWLDLKRSMVGIGGKSSIYYRAYSLYCFTKFCTGDSKIDWSPNKGPTLHELKPIETSSSAESAEDLLRVDKKKKVLKLYRATASSR